MSDTDEALARRAQAGDRAALGRLIERHYPATLALCRRLLGPGPEAEDVAQEAALSACLGLARLREPARFGAWLHAIAANQARMALRRRRPLPLLALDEPGESVLLWGAGPPTPEEVALMRELHDAVMAALGELSPLSREAVVGFYLQGYSYAELAAILNVPVGTLKGRLVFGRRQLRGRLGQLAGEAPADSRRGRPPRRREEAAVTEPALIPVTIDSVRMSTLNQHRVVVLKEAGAGGRSLPIWIGPWEADAIQTALEGQQFPRPMTHDLSLSLLAPLGARVASVTISKVVDNTFISEVELRAGEASHRIDARPSDALALAVRAGASILVSPEVLDQGAIVEADATVPLERGAPHPRPSPVLLLSEQGQVLDQLLKLIFMSVSNPEVAIFPAAYPADDMEALAELARAQRPGAILVANLGGAELLDQLALVRGLRPDMPALALGPDDPALRARAEAAGAMRYLAKPVEAAELHKAVLDAHIEALRAARE